jgi:hypothetical protein
VFGVTHLEAKGKKTVQVSDGDDNLPPGRDAYGALLGGPGRTVVVRETVTTAAVKKSFRRSEELDAFLDAKKAAT